jgi:CBS domain containing-hemolysin-like protein
VPSLVARFVIVPIVLVVLAAPDALLAAISPTSGAESGPAGPGDAVALVAYILLALVFSFLCSISEAVLLSLTPAYIEGLQATRPALGRRLYRLKVRDVDRSLAAILTLNTIAHTVGAIGSGAKAVVVFGNAYFGVFSALMTLAILFLSEIIPKTIGAVHWRHLAGPTAVFVQLLIWLLYPLILISERITRGFARGHDTKALQRHELVAMASLGEQTGEIAADESRIIRNLLRLGELTVRDVMTPRPVIASLAEDMTVAEAVAIVRDLPFSRLPVHRGDIDRISGFVLRDEVLLSQAQTATGTPLTELKRDILAIGDKLSLRRVFETLLENHGVHIALVVDEFGGTAGLVTMEDVVETLLGLEIVDELDQHVDMQAMARRRWRERARRMGLAIDPADDAPTPPDAVPDPDGEAR